MKEDLFRKSSMDRLKSPEQLNEYIRVVRPGVWLVLTAVILLLAGVFVWGIFGSAESVLEVNVYAGDGRAVCFVGAEDAHQLQPGLAVDIQGKQGSVLSVSPAAEETHPLLAYGIPSDELYLVELDAPGLEEGVHAGRIVVESIQPIRFITQ